MRSLSGLVQRVAVELPEKQGLKLYNVELTLLLTFTVAVELPEKQGLKPFYYIECLLSYWVAVELPEKQGLKHR